MASETIALAVRISFPWDPFHGTIHVEHPTGGADRLISTVGERTAGTGGRDERFFKGPAAPNPLLATAPTLDAPISTLDGTSP